ncbi:DUF5752 family protein [Nanoarchaeota archaeon]
MFTNSSQEVSKVSKKKSSKALKNAKKDSYFILAEGTAVKNLFELAHSLNKMSDEEFHHHVTNDRNDFSNWIEAVLEEKTLAKELREMDNRKDIQISILNFLIKKLK